MSLHRMSVCLLLVVAAGLVALAPATPSAEARNSVTFMHSATSGEFEGGRLTLHGVGPRLAWFSGGGGSGFASVRRAHRELFPSARHSHTGLLHVSGRRRGGVPAFSLSRPRYNARRRTVSYRARPLSRLAAAGRRAVASQRGRRSFERATVTIVPRAVGGYLGISCSAALRNHTQETMRLVSASHWDTDFWDLLWGNPPTPGTVIGPDDSTSWASDAPPFRGCSATFVLEFAPDDPTLKATITITVSWDVHDAGPTGSCTSTNWVVVCAAGPPNPDADFAWVIELP